MTVSVEGARPDWPLTDRLRRAREFAGLDQAKLAVDLGVSKNTISNYERGFTRPRRSQLLAWAMATGVALAWLEDEECAVRDSNPEPADYCLEHAA